MGQSLQLIAMANFSYSNTDVLHTKWIGLIFVTVSIIWKLASLGIGIIQEFPWEPSINCRNSANVLLQVIFHSIHTMSCWWQKLGCSHLQMCRCPAGSSVQMSPMCVLCNATFCYWSCLRPTFFFFFFWITERKFLELCPQRLAPVKVLLLVKCIFLLDIIFII